MLVVSSPSGAGKTTLTRRIVNTDPAFGLSISVTTRARRPGEVDGEHYHFISEAEFMRRRDAGDLLEWAEVFGSYYGTPRSDVMARIESGLDVAFDVDWQGAQKLRAAAKEDIVSVFILPPSPRELMSRLIRRGQDDLDVITRRMRAAAHEMSHWSEYEFVIINDDLETAFSELVCIVRAERIRRDRRIGVGELVDAMNSRLSEQQDGG